MAEGPTTQGGALQVRVDAGEGGSSRVFLAGVIGENTDLPRAFEALSGDVVLNLRDIERLNSIGVHHWIAILTRVLETHRVEIEELSYPFVLQANRVSNLFATAKVRSCLAPYFCAHCDASTTSVVASHEVAQLPSGAPERRCPSCGGTMEFDELDSYFDFLRG